MEGERLIREAVANQLRLLGVEMPVCWHRSGRRSNDEPMNGIAVRRFGRSEGTGPTVPDRLTDSADARSNYHHHDRSGTAMKIDPVTLFKKWLAEESEVSASPVPEACCLSTSGLDGFPNARFVALKQVDDRGFVISGPLSARKGKEIELSPKVALTFWWPATQRQVRVQGWAERLPDTDSDRLFQERPVVARLVSMVSRQGEPLEDFHAFAMRYRRLLDTHQHAEIARPPEWGAVLVAAIRIELLEFSSDRLHHRILFTRNGSAWKGAVLQP